MADQAGVDTEKQAAATINVVESGQAVTSSAQGSSSLSAAQKSMFWGQEAGPHSMGTSSFHMFDAISDALAKEAALISKFETEINAAVESFTGTELENKLQLEKIQEALDRVDKSDAAAEAKVAQHKVNRFLQGLSVASAIPHAQGTPSSSTTGGSTSSTTSGGSAPTTTPGPRKY